jgi:hypothetical protein
MTGPGAAAEPRQTAGPTAVRSVGSHSSRGAWGRGLVHLGLLVTAAGALATLTILYIRNAIHADIGLAFVGLVVVHLAQRRRTVARMMSQLRRAKSFAERRIRLVASDVILAFLTLNVLVSGVLDWSRGEPIQLPLPPPFDRWHLLSSVALVIYLVVHVWRRRKRLRRSTIQ